MSDNDRLARIRAMREGEQQPQRIEDDHFIVAEISKNWPEEPVSLSTMTEPVPKLLAQRFELCINNNWNRGYRLVDWKLDRLISQHNNHINETIIAVFERFERGFKS